jgi:hypothetical protein
MDWHDIIRDWGPLMLAAIPNCVLAGQWAMRKEFATTDGLLTVHKVLDDRDRELEDSITRAHHRIDLLIKDVEGLPGYDTTNEIKKELGELSISREKNAALIERALTKLDNIDEYLRTRP